MKIIDAYWEKRNIGIDCIEISIDKFDTIGQLIEVLERHATTDYIIIKVPVACLDFNEFLANHGFTFVEGSINFQLKVKDAKLNPLQQRLNAAISYSEMDAADLIQLYAEMENGLFKTDRISLDNNFSAMQASSRYIYWINDELEKTSKAYKIIYKGVVIGFFTFKAITFDSYYPFLAGLYSNFAKSGLGFTTLRKPIEEAIHRNGKSISTFASTNNPYVVRAHIEQGFTIVETQYVFVKHNNKI
jgi:hypothetical protein